MATAPAEKVHPIVQIAAGLVVALLAFGLAPAACGAGGQLTPLMRCKLDALKILPKDPAMATPYDVADIVTRIRACHEEAADGGKP